jgi:hypothetical protein
MKGIISWLYFRFVAPNEVEMLAKLKRQVVLELQRKFAKRIIYIAAKAVDDAELEKVDRRLKAEMVAVESMEWLSHQGRC